MQIVLSLLFCFMPFVLAEGSAPQKFMGFEQGQNGFGALLGVPVGARYQRWHSYKHASFYTLGFVPPDELVVIDGNYSWYQLDEEDRWRRDNKVGNIFYNYFIGGTVGFYVGSGEEDEEDEKTRAGVRLGASFEYLLPQSRLSLRLELAPVLFLVGPEAAGVQGGLLLTYYMPVEGRKGERPVKAIKKKK